MRANGGSLIRSLQLTTRLSALQKRKRVRKLNCGASRTNISLHAASTHCRDLFSRAPAQALGFTTASRPGRFAGRRRFLFTKPKRSIYNNA